MDQKVINRVKKLKELAIRGVGGEKETAQKLLDEILEKYQISLEEINLEDEEVNDYDFSFHGADERKILVQVMYKVTNTSTYYTLTKKSTGRQVKTRVCKSCTASQKLEIEILFEFYTRLWYEEKNYFMKAFIRKHNLYGDPTDDDKPLELTHEEMMKIQAMELGLSDKRPLKMIESGPSSSS